MRIKEVNAKKILDSRQEETIAVFIETDKGTFSASSPSGKSKGRHETPAFAKSAAGSIELLKKLTEKIKEIKISEFNDLEKVEEIAGKIGANTLYALEASILKALAAENKQELWELLNDKARRFPFPVGNVIGGGMHTEGKKPDFQEFLVIPRLKNFSDNVFVMRKFWELAGKRLELRGVIGKPNDENAFSTSLGNESCLEVMHETKEELGNELDEGIEIGMDVAGSSFYTGMIYNYKNPVKRLKESEQIKEITSFVEKFMLSYIEDPLNEEDFSGFKVLRETVNKKRPCLIVADDLVASQLDRLKKAIESRSINAVIVKPNQSGSLLEIKKLIDLAKKNNIACIMSHRSGETQDNTIADLAFSWNCEFIKTGITGRERETKLRRLVEIERKV